ncbi:MAG: FAD-binding oxidoreductase [Pirellulales bacterium]|nr:FAD-binding oxidoreductase [Pirellulales bacterium]
MSVLLNDIHSRLNRTRVRLVETPRSLDELQAIVGRSEQTAISISGGRHAMGGQQFGEDTIHIDTRSLDQVLEFDAENGLIRVQAGIQWPALIERIREHDGRGKCNWSIRQKQTGASDLTLGGALAANAHGRGLTMAPFISDVESFTLIDCRGQALVCSRNDNESLFRLAIGGYGLFGIIHDVTLRLSPRRRVQRLVDVETIDRILARFRDEIRRGTLYGDFQFAIDHQSEDFLRRGIFSRYRPVDPATPIPHDQIYFSEEKWLSLLRLARTHRTEAYHQYVRFYQSTHGQIYDSDTHQLSTYVPRYHDRLADLPETAQGSEVISELYVPPESLTDFMQQAAEVLRQCQAPLTYGTVRLIQADHESFLNWAKQDYACVIFNLLTPETDAGRERTAVAFRRLYDLALAGNGCFFLTYHAFAQRSQVLAAYPQMPQFLRSKQRYDPQERFQSNWYRHMKRIIENDSVG